MTEEEIRADERRKMWEKINSWIVKGPLPGNGWDQTAQRNGLILAANMIAEAEIGPTTIRLVTCSSPR